MVVCEEGGDDILSTQSDLRVVWTARRCDRASFPILTCPFRVLIEAKRLTASEQRRGSIEVDLGNRNVTVDYRCFENDILIAGRYVRHRFSDPVKVEMRIRSDCECKAPAASEGGG